MQGIVDTAIAALKILVVAAILFLAISYFLWLRSGDSEVEKYRSALTAVSHSSALITGFAQVDVFRIKTRQGWTAINAFAGDRTQAKNFADVQGFCSRTYDVSFGYRYYADDLSRLTASSGANQIPYPVILSTSLVDSYEWGDNAAKECLKHDSGSIELQVKDALIADEYWDTHLSHGQLVFADLADLGKLDCAESTQSKEGGAKETHNCTSDKLRQMLETQRALPLAARRLITWCQGESSDAPQSAACKAAKQRVDGVIESQSDMELSALHEQMASSDESTEREIVRTPMGGYSSAIMLTLSLNAVVDRERRVKFLHIIPLWKKEAFLFRREVAEVTYGSFVSTADLKSSWSPIGRSRLVLSIERPRVLSVGRKITAQGYAGDLNELSKDEPVSMRINNGLRQALDRSLQGYTSRAISLSESVLRRRFGSGKIEVEFRDQRPEDRALVDALLLRGSAGADI